MNPKLVIATIVVALIPWLSGLLLILKLDAFAWNEIVFYVFAGLWLSTAVFWIVFTVIASIVVLPKLDRLARPDMADMIKRTDSWWFRVMRLNGYGGALTCRRIRKVEDLPVDLREQGRELRWPLYAYIYSMQLGGVLMVILALAMYFAPDLFVIE